MTSILEGPETADEIYLAGLAEVGPYRPVLTGDIYREITIAGVGIDHQCAMVISHPCNMRSGPALRERIQMIPVVEYDNIPLSHWTTGGHARVFPLPELELLGASACAARFDETGMVASSELTVERRAVSLTERGILLLLQRQIYSLSRAAISIETLESAVAHVLAEAELLEDWNEALAPGRAATASDIESALAVEAVEFDAYLGASSSEASLREQLRDQHRRAGVRRAVRTEILRRTSGA